MRWCIALFFYTMISEVRAMDLIEYMTGNGTDFDLAVIISENYN